MQRFRALVIPLCALALVALPAVALADTSFAELTNQFEQQYGLPSGILGKVAKIESGGNVNAGNPNSAYGLYQWLPSSWESASKALYGQPLNPSLRTDPTVSTAVTAFALADAKSKLGGLITQSGIDMSVGLYMAHFLGINGAQHFISDYIQGPGQSACALFPKECSYNQSILGNRTLAQVVNLFAGEMQVAGVPNITGNFQDSMGVSYAYSTAYLQPSYFLPAGTVIGTDPQYDYPATYTTVAQQPAAISSATTGTTGVPLSGAPQTSVPASYTTPSAAAAALSNQSTSTTSPSCTAQYICTNGDLYYQTSSCQTSVSQICAFGCAGSMCTPGALETSGTSTSVFDILGSLGPSAASSAADTFLSGSSAYTIVQIGEPSGATTTATSAPEFAGENMLSGQDTFTPNYLGNPSATLAPLSGIFTALQSVLLGILAYLRSL